MTDREMLELAAKAAGLTLADEIDSYIPGSRALWIVGPGGRDVVWQPYGDDGDALRLAVKLGIKVTPFLSGACAVATPDGWTRTESGYENGGTATRRAITRAAAEIGRATKET